MHLFILIIKKILFHSEKRLGIKIDPLSLPEAQDWN